jgi:protein involved in polysaccharide export with SLBB domain
MKYAFPLASLLLTIVLPAPSVRAQSVSPDLKSSDKTASAHKASGNDDRRNQTAAAETPAAGNSEDSAKPGSAQALLEAQKLYDSGITYFTADKLEDAIGAFKEAARLRPDDAQTHYSLGMAYTKAKSYKDAADSFRRAVKFSPDWPEANFRVGMISYVLGRKSQSVEAYNKLVKLNSPLAKTLFGIINEESGPTGVPENPSVAPEQRTKPAEVVQVSATAKEKNTAVRLEAPASSSAKAPVKPTRNGSAVNESRPKQNGSTVNEGRPKENRSAVNEGRPKENGSAVNESGPKENGSAVNEARPMNQPSNEVAPIPVSAAPPATDQVLMSTYRVGVGDILDIRLLNSISPGSTLYTVVDGGLIDLPIAGGLLSVAGLTTDEIQRRVAGELKRRAVENNAMVTVGVRQYSSHSVIVTGLVSNPGSRFLRREAVPLYVLMAEAQPRLDAGRVTILRAGSERQTVDLNDSAALSALVRPGDVVNVSARPQEFYYIGGRVNYAGQKPYQPGITLLQAILAAGGTSQNDNNIDLSREGNDGRLNTIRYNLKDIKSGKTEDPKLKPGDRIELVH